MNIDQRILEVSVGHHFSLDCAGFLDRLTQCTSRFDRFGSGNWSDIIPSFTVSQRSDCYLLSFLHKCKTRRENVLIWFDVSYSSRCLSSDRLSKSPSVEINCREGKTAIDSQRILSDSEWFASDLPFSCKYMCAALMALALFLSSFLFLSMENIQHFKHNGS